MKHREMKNHLSVNLDDKKQFKLNESMLNYFTPFVTSAAKQIYNQIFEMEQGTYVAIPNYGKA